MEFELQAFIESELGFTRIKLAIIGVLWLSVFFAMILDLISGLLKAKKAGIATSSELLKRTTSKVIKNYTALMFMIMFDMLFFWVTTYFKAVDLSYFPIPSIAMAMFEIFVEYKSFRENLNDKQRIKDAEALAELLDIAKSIKNNELLRKQNP